MLTITDHRFKESFDIIGLWLFKDTDKVVYVAPYLGEVPHELNILRPIHHKHRNLTHIFKKHKKHVYENKEEFSIYGTPSFGNESLGTYYPERGHTKIKFAGVIRKPISLDKYKVDLVIFKNKDVAINLTNQLLSNENVVWDNIDGINYIMR